MLVRVASVFSARATMASGTGDVEHEVDVLAEQWLTWDQGKEMAAHKRFSIETGLPVYFCDLRSPWQRGSNENMNGLLRQYMPKRTSLAPFSQADLDTIATELNGRLDKPSDG